MIGLIAYLALVVAIPALLCGHQAQDFPPARWRRGRRARAAKASEQPAAARRRPVPSWAHTEPYDYDIEEAA